MTDTYSGQIFLLNADLSSLVGQRVDSWSFFNNNSSQAVTPVLVEDLGGNSFAIRGIGATIFGTGSGVQGGPFNLAGGVDIISLNHYLGYYDGSWNGSAATPNPGGVEFDSIDEPPVPGQIDSAGTIWLHNNPDGSNNPANLGVGALNTSDLTFSIGGRQHSLNFTVVPVPEPSAHLLGSLSGLALLIRRRSR